VPKSKTLKVKPTQLVPLEVQSCGQGNKHRKWGSKQTAAVDRDRTCPFLLRVFYKIDEHHDLRDFAVRGKEPVAEELQIYTWTDATLREIADLIKDVSPEARERNARLQFKLIYPDKAGRNVMADIGTIHSQRRGRDDTKTLQAAKFQIGDFIDLAIILPKKGLFNRVRGEKNESDIPSHTPSGEQVVAEGRSTETPPGEEDEEEEGGRSPLPTSNEVPHEDDMDDTDALKLEE